MLLAVGAWAWRGDILRTALDPRIPYPTYDPPPTPDYRQTRAWALLPSGAEAGPMDVFFVHPTTFSGGRHWNGPIDAREAERVLLRDMIPNHAGPYQRLGRVFAPRYRQASLYSLLTLRDDARDARRFAYGDVRSAFRTWKAHHDRGRPLLIVGVEQGGALAARLLAEEVAPDPALRGRLVAAHLIETVTPPIPGLPVCHDPRQRGCVLAFISAPAGDEAMAERRLERALVWRGDRLEALKALTPVCVNPLLGAPGAATSGANRGAANATGLEWGARPAFLRHEVAAACRTGVLHVTQPKADALKRPQAWAARRRASPFNLFYLDLEADAQRRLGAFSPPPPRPPAASRTTPPAA